MPVHPHHIYNTVYTIHAVYRALLEKYFSMCKTKYVTFREITKSDSKISDIIYEHNIVMIVNDTPINNLTINSKIVCNIDYDSIIDMMGPNKKFVIDSNNTINISNEEDNYPLIIILKNINSGGITPKNVSVIAGNKSYLLIVHNCNIVINPKQVEQFTNTQIISSDYLPSSHNILLILILIMIVGYYSGYRIKKTK